MKNPKVMLMGCGFCYRVSTKYGIGIGIRGRYFLAGPFFNFCFFLRGFDTYCFASIVLFSALDTDVGTCIIIM